LYTIVFKESAPLEKSRPKVAEATRLARAFSNGVNRP